TVLGDREAVLGGWMSHDINEPVITYAPMFSNINSTYDVNIKMLTIDQDSNFLTSGIAPQFNSHFSTIDQNQFTITMSK
ncbi:MAG: hypothetical protein ACRDFB_08315, partial [Rhabdochlamydiaceae bacterium]